MSDISLTTPNDYTGQLAEVERKRLLAQALQQQSMQPLESTGSVGGVPTAISPYAGLAKMLNAFTGASAQKRATEQQTEVGRQYRADLQDTLSRALQAGSGSPARPAMQDPQELQQQADQGTAAPAPIAAQAPDPQAAAAILMGHPGTQALGQQQLMQEMSRKALIAALQGGNGAQGAPQAAGGTQPIAAPTAPAQAGPAPGGPAGGVPMAVWLQSDPSGKSYIEQLAKDNREGGKPVINRGFGVGRMVNGQYVPDKASETQALDLTRGKQAIELPYRSPVSVPTESGQSVTAFPSEFPALQAGQTPARLAAPAAAPSAPPQTGGAAPPGTDRARILAEEMDTAKGALAAAKQKGDTVAIQRAEGNIAALQREQPGLGRIGVTQSQPEQLRQSAQTASNTEAGREFISEMRQNYAKLRDVPATLQNIDHAKELAAGSARAFMGPLGESKLAITKFFRSNVPGMANLNTAGVTSAEELQSTLFNQVMDNLKKMDASPSQYQQQVMQEAFGTLRTDPASVPKILDVFAEILKNRVSIHNDTVRSAESRGTNFPYDVSIKLEDSAKAAVPQQRRATDKAAGVKFLGFEQQNANR